MKHFLFLASIILLSCTPYQDETPASIAQMETCADSTFIIFKKEGEVKVSKTVPFAAMGNDNYESVLATLGPNELNLFGEPWINNVLSVRMSVIGYLYQYPTIYLVYDPVLRSPIYAQRMEPSPSVLSKKEVVRVQQVGTCLVVRKYVFSNNLSTWKQISPF